MMRNTVEGFCSPWGYAILFIAPCLMAAQRENPSPCSGNTVLKRIPVKGRGDPGYLYTTGHDHAGAYVLEVDKTNKLNCVRIEKDVGFVGQAIAWDRFSEKPILWGIVGNKHVSLALIPGKKKQP